jgi:hypothetical protein
MVFGVFPVSTAMHTLLAHTPCLLPCIVPHQRDAVARLRRSTVTLMPHAGALVTRPPDHQPGCSPSRIAHALLSSVNDPKVISPCVGQAGRLFGRCALRTRTFQTHYYAYSRARRAAGGRLLPLPHPKKNYIVSVVPVWERADVRTVSELRCGMPLYPSLCMHPAGATNPPQSARALRSTTMSNHAQSCSHSNTLASAARLTDASTSACTTTARAKPCASNLSSQVWHCSSSGTKHCSGSVASGRKDGVFSPSRLPIGQRPAIQAMMASRCGWQGPCALDSRPQALTISHTTRIEFQTITQSAANVRGSTRLSQQ